MKTVFSWILFALTAPWAILGWLWVTLLCLFVFAELSKLHFEGTGVLVSEWKPWVAKFYHFSTTIGRGIIFYPGSKDRVAKHEQVHVNQVEDLMLLSLILGMLTIIFTGNVFIGFLLWMSGGIWQIPNFATAMLRNGHRVTWTSEGPFASRLKKFLFDLFMGVAYRTCEHERSAYAQTDLGLDGTSWADHQAQ